MQLLDLEHYKEVVGHFATGVVVVTSVDDDGPIGFTCQTFGSLSLDPVLISFSARSKSTSWPRIRNVGVVGLNILSLEQESLARTFATSDADKFAGVAWSPGPQGTPFLAGTIARLEGSVTTVGSYGDHDIAVVEVRHGELSPGSPLLYYRGGYRELGD